MTHQEILEKAIKKAVKQGWAEGIKYLDAFYQLQDVKDFKDYQYGAFIFSHDFAKALWGESDSKKCTCKKMGCTCGAIFPGDYKFHLQQMVISDDPIEYLGDNI